MSTRQDQIWVKLWKDNSPEICDRVISWRKQEAITRIDRPSHSEPRRLEQSKTRHCGNSNAYGTCRTENKDPKVDVDQNILV